MLFFCTFDQIVVLHHPSLHLYTERDAGTWGFGSSVLAGCCWISCCSLVRKGMERGRVGPWSRSMRRAVCDGMADLIEGARGGSQGREAVAVAICVMGVERRACLWLSRRAVVAAAASIWVNGRHWAAAVAASTASKRDQPNPKENPNEILPKISTSCAGRAREINQNQKNPRKRKRKERRAERAQIISYHW